MTPPAATAAERAHQPLAPVRTRPVPSRPRRISGPARPARPAAPARRPQHRSSAQSRPLVAALGRLLERLSEHRLLDRLISGKAWIGLVAFALIGIVTLQLALLQLNSSIGRSLVREAALQRADATLAIENSTMAEGDLVETRAAGLGMSIVPIGSIRFLSVGPSDLTRELRSLSTPLESQATGAEGVSAAASSEAASQGNSGEGGHEGTGGAAAGSSEGASQATSEGGHEGTGEATAGSSEGAPQGATGEGAHEATGEAASGSTERSTQASGGAGEGTGGG